MKWNLMLRWSSLALLPSIAFALAAFAEKPPAKSAARKKAAPDRVVPDLGDRLARWKPVSMPFDSAALSPRERQLVEKLVDASRDLEDIYWRQSDPEDIALYNDLAIPVKTFVESTEDRLRLFYLPAYSPELNPDEQVWNQLQNHRIGKMFIKSLDDMVKKVASTLRSIQRSPALIRSFFKHKECCYAAE